MGILTDMLVCEDMTSCTDLAHRHIVDELLYNCSKYFLGKHCLL